MLKKILTISVSLNILTVLPSFAKDFSGTYTYKDNTWNDGKADQKINISIVKGIVKGAFLGVESAGEGCCAYFKNNMENLKIDKDGNISFLIKNRKLFLKREDIGKKKNDGMTNAELKFKGKFKNNNLVLECNSAMPSDCYITIKMDFKKK